MRNAKDLKYLKSYNVLKRNVKVFKVLPVASAPPSSLSLPGAQSPVCKSSCNVVKALA